MNLWEELSLVVYTVVVAPFAAYGIVSRLVEPRRSPVASREPGYREPASPFTAPASGLPPLDRTTCPYCLETNEHSNHTGPLLPVFCSGRWRHVGCPRGPHMHCRCRTCGAKWFSATAERGR